jgi:hypothetical protein
MKKALREIVRIFIVMFISALLISITWQISSAANKYDHMNPESRYSDFGFTQQWEKEFFIKQFTESSLRTMILTIGKLKNRKLSIQILKDDQYWSDLKVIFNELAIKFTESDMTFSELFDEAFYQGLQHAVKLKKTLTLSQK